MLGIPVLLSVALLIITVFVRWRFKDDDDVVHKKLEKFPNLQVEPQHSIDHPPRENIVTQVDAFGFDEFRPTVVSGRHQCALCFSPTNTRCSRCKAVRYCFVILLFDLFLILIALLVSSSKCQIAHWRQGHKYECYPRDPNVFEVDNSSGNVDTGGDCERNSIDSTKSLSTMNDKGTINQRHSDLSDSHITIPRLSTVSNDSSDNTIGRHSIGEREERVLDMKTPIMVRKVDKSSTMDFNIPLKSQSASFGNSVDISNKEKVRQSHGTKARAFHSDPSPHMKKDKSSEGAILGDKSQSQEVEDVDPSLNEREKHLHAFKYGEAKSLARKQSGASFLPVKGGSSSSLLPSDGFKSSLAKVVQHLKPIHQKKPPIKSTVLEAPSKHSCKVVFPYETFTRLFSSNEVDLKPFGLINCGNSCYANAVLQCLAYTRPLTLFLLQGLHSKGCWKEDWCFTCEFEHLMSKARDGQSPLSPVQILSNITHLGHGREEDAHEFLRYAVEAMQSACIEQAGISGPVAEETTLIGMTFGGYLLSKIKCMKCHNRSEKYERMMDLSVEIGGDIRTLEQALKRFTASEILEGDNKYHCSRCKSYEKAKKKLTVFQAPNILTVVLKRFQADSFTKLKKPVRFPETLNMTPYMSHTSDRFPEYILYAVVVHLDVRNAAYFGHYVCYVKNYRDEWFKIDDNVVINVDVRRVLSEEAYMLLYARHSPMFPALIGNTHDDKLAANLEAGPRPSYVKSAIPKARRHSSDFSADPSMIQQQSSRNGHLKNPSYLEEWVTHSVESIPMMDSSSESSLFSCSEEGTCSTPSTKDSGSVEDFSDYIFGRGSAAR